MSVPATHLPAPLPRVWTAHGGEARAGKATACDISHL